MPIERLDYEKVTTFIRLLFNQKVVKKINDIINYINGSSGSGSHKAYVALLTQSGTTAPIATVIQNTLGGTVVWTYSGVGVYVGTLASAFTTDKTVLFTNNAVLDTQTLSYQISANAVELDILTLAGVAGNNKLTAASIEIRVYN